MEARDDGMWDPANAGDGSPPPAAYTIPDATIAGDPTFLGVILAAIVAVLFFWRRKKDDA